MNTTEINDLETQVDSLLLSVEQLKLENQSLKHKLGNQTREQARLRECNKQAANKIKQIIGQLKEELT